MLVLSLFTSLAALFASRRNKGPEWAMALMWTICIAPIAIGMIDFLFINTERWLLDVVVSGSIVCVFLGAAIYRLYAGAYVPVAVNLIREQEDFEQARRLCRVLWLIGMGGGLLLITDFLVLGNRSLSNIVELRDSFVLQEGASVFARLASVMTWACPFCFLFAIIFRDRLQNKEIVFFILPIGAFLLGALLSAGRQAAFQVLILTIIGQVLYRIRHGDNQAKSGRGFLYVVVGAMIGYMGFIAIVRNDSRISDIKSEVLARLFDFTTAKWFDTVIAPLGSAIRETLIEAVVYFTSSVALFDKFLDSRLEGMSFGAMNFPFVFRQLTPVTGIDVAQMYEFKVATLNAQNVIGVGWTTSVSHLIMDFGLLGAAVALIIQGWVGAWSWRQALVRRDFISYVFATLMTLAAIYIPLLPAFSDTNLFLMLVFIFAWRIFGPKNLSRRTAPPQSSAHL